MDVAAWRRRLEETFLANSAGHLGLEAVKLAEDDYELWATQEMQGHFVVLDSLQAFMLDTINQVALHRGSKALKGRMWYAPNLFEYTTAFRSLRACENIFRRGYPMSGYALLRDLKDRVLFLCAVGRGLTSLNKLWGLEGIKDGADKEVESEAIRKRAEAEKKRVLNVMLRKSEDLGEHGSTLLKWERNFNQEVHGARLSSSHLFVNWVKGPGDLPLAPERDEVLASQYMNRVREVGWPLMRLLPLLQPTAGVFGAEWGNSWHVLDDSFRAYHKASEPLNKPKLTAIVRGFELLAEKRFDFTPENSSYQSCLE